MQHLQRDARSAFAAALGGVLAVAAALVIARAAGIVAAIAAVGLLAALVPALDRGLGHHPHRQFGWANRVTLLRAALVAGLAGRTLDPLPIAASERWALGVLAAFALLLDGLDGWAARRQRLVSPYGARFDLEIDAVAVLALSVLALRAAAAPVWVLAIGGLRYVVLAGAGLWPPLGRTPPDSGSANRRRKTIGLIQGVVLIATVMPAMPPQGARFACAAALLLLIYSFAADVAGGNGPGGIKE